MDAHSKGQSLSGLGLRGFLLRRLQQVATINETELVPGRQLQGTFGAAPKAQLSFTDEAPVTSPVTTSSEMASGLSA